VVSPLFENRGRVVRTTRNAYNDEMQIDSITRNKDSPRIVNGLKFPELNDSFEQRVKSKPG